MIQFIFKTIIALAALGSAVVFATEEKPPHSSIYDAQLGCMGCHRDTTIQTEEASEESSDLTVAKTKNPK